MVDVKQKWNQKHRDKLDKVKILVPNDRLKYLLPHLKGNHALDIACGLGANSILLAKNRFQVEALDISEVAIDYLQEQVQKRNLSVVPKLWDISKDATLPCNETEYDLVIMTYFLYRPIFPVVKSVVKKNGYVFMETHYKSPLMNEEKVSDTYKLTSNELLSVFKNWRVAFYEEDESRGIQTILVQKI